jgi:hypothetical protein
MRVSKFDKKSEAVNLRKKGSSIKEISKIVGVSRSTASLWCRDVLLSEKQKNTLREKMIKAGHADRLKGARVNRERRLENIRKSQKFADEIFPSLISTDNFMFTGLSLYWAEGSKNENRAIFTNSDPKMILIMIKWFKQFFNVNNLDFMPRIYLNKDHEYRKDEILIFWSNLLKFPTSQFGNIIYRNIDHKKIYENANGYHGVVSLRISKSAIIKYKIDALINKLKMSG